MAKQRRSAEAITSILNDYRASGQTQIAFATERDVPLSSLTLWLRRSRRAEGSPAAAPSKSPWVPVVTRQVCGEVSGIRIQLRNDRSIELSGPFPLESLAALATHLEQE